MRRAPKEKDLIDGIPRIWKINNLLKYIFLWMKFQYIGTYLRGIYEWESVVRVNNIRSTAMYT